VGTCCKRERERARAREREKDDSATLSSRFPKRGTSSIREASRRHSDGSVLIPDGASALSFVRQWPVSWSAGRESEIYVYTCIYIYIAEIPECLDYVQPGYRTSLSRFHPPTNPSHVHRRYVPRLPHRLEFRTLQKSSSYTENEYRRCKLVICHGWKVGRLSGDRSSLSQSLFLSLFPVTVRFSRTNGSRAAGHIRGLIRPNFRGTQLSRIEWEVCVSQLFWRHSKRCDATKMFVDRWPRRRCAIIALLHTDFAYIRMD